VKVKLGKNQLRRSSGKAGGNDNADFIVAMFFVEFRNKVVGATSSAGFLVTPKMASFQFTITVSAQQQQYFMFLNLIYRTTLLPRRKFRQKRQQFAEVAQRRRDAFINSNRQAISAKTSTWRV